MRKTELTPEQLAELAALDAMPDEAIDTSDARELTEEEWNDPRRRRPSYRVEPVSYEIDAQVSLWFENNPEGVRPEVEINRVLLDYVRDQRRRSFG